MWNWASVIGGVGWLGLSVAACTPSVRSSRIEGPGMAAYRIDCTHLEGCVQRARQLCPAGYELAGAGASLRERLPLLDLLGGESDDAEYVRNEMIVQCTPPETKPVVGPDRPTLRSMAEFQLEAAEATARATCDGAGFAWEAHGEWHRCRGIVAEPDAPGYTLIRFCNAKICALRVVYGPYEPDDGTWFDRFADLRQHLAIAHGEPRVADLERLHRCGRQPTRCLEKKSERLQLVWTWPDHHLVELTARGIASSGPFVMVTYAAPAYTREQHLQRM